MVVKDHMYDSPIVDIKFHSSINGRAGKHIISADRHIVKVGGPGRGSSGLVLRRGTQRACMPRGGVAGCIQGL